MSEPKPFASLTPTLLARKGGAKPAMRRQVQAMPAFHGGAAQQLESHRPEDDLGWNDMGHDHDHDHGHAAQHATVHADQHVAQVVPIVSTASVPEGAVPEVVRQQHAIAEQIVPKSETRRSALAEGRRAAFTLRLDAARHLELRLACALSNRSAQQLVTEALDRLIAEMPDVSALAVQFRQRARKASRGERK